MEIRVPLTHSLVGFRVLSSLCIVPLTGTPRGSKINSLRNPELSSILFGDTMVPNVE